MGEGEPSNTTTAMCGGRVCMRGKVQRGNLSHRYKSKLQNWEGQQWGCHVPVGMGQIWGKWGKVVGWEPRGWGGKGVGWGRKAR